MTEQELLYEIYNRLKKHNFTIATAESCTGGLIAHTLTNIPGSSEYFDRGIVSYSNESKIELLNVPDSMIIKHGAVSEKVAKAMAEGIRIKSNVDIGISTTGIAGPTGGTKDKPVGLVYIGVSTKKKTIIKKFNFSGDRIQNKNDACNAVLLMLLEAIM